MEFLIEIENFLKNHNIQSSHPICKAIGFRSFYNLSKKKKIMKKPCMNL